MRKEALEKIRQATTNDVIMQELTLVILKGWPHEIRDVRLEIKMYFQFRDDVVVEDVIVHKIRRLIVPTALREEMNEKLHSSHMGIEKYLRRARDTTL